MWVDAIHHEDFKHDKREQYETCPKNLKPPFLYCVNVLKGTVAGILAKIQTFSWLR